VALVVSKLLNVVRPDFSVFGQKDAQQAILIRRMAQDLNLPGEIVVAPTVREADGLAMSSRNRYLSREERKAALALSRGLFAAERAYQEGGRDCDRLVGLVRREIDAERLLRPEYIEIRDLESLDPWEGPERPALLAVAVRVGQARLIDNVFLGQAKEALRPAENKGKGDQVTHAMAIILAAGEGKRMNSSLPKVLHEVGGEPLLAHVGRAARESGVDRIVVVIGKGAETVRSGFASERWEFVVQTERLGTGDAVRRAKEQLEAFEGEVVVLAGDTPLLKSGTIRRLRDEHRKVGAAVTVLTAKLERPFGYGRVVRAKDTGEFLKIVEHKDATKEELEIAEVNSSVYCFNAADLRSVLWRISDDNTQGEVYLTDAVGLLRERGKKVWALLAASPEEILGVNTPDQLEEIQDILAKRGSAPAEGIR
jgi:CTP:molybdopterin cytidylyltransferase MocA